MTTFRTSVDELPPTPLGMLPRRWAVEHRCTLCHRNVDTADLITHAQAHTAAAEQQSPDRLP